jgi:hypothetical protein
MTPETNHPNAKSPRRPTRIRRYLVAAITGFVSGLTRAVVIHLLEHLD